MEGASSALPFTKLRQAASKARQAAKGYLVKVNCPRVAVVCVRVATFHAGFTSTLSDGSLVVCGELPKRPCHPWQGLGVHRAQGGVWLSLDGEALQAGQPAVRMVALRVSLDGGL